MNHRDALTASLLLLVVFALALAALLLYLADAVDRPAHRRGPVRLDRETLGVALLGSASIPLVALIGLIA